MVLYEYINRLNQWLESTTFNDSPTIRTEKNDAGWTFHVKNMPTITSGGGGSISHLCKITSGSGSIYEVDYYDNGMDATSTGSGTVQVLQAGPSDTLPVGTWIIGTEIKANVLV